ncbi:integral membrane regulator [Streptomyces sp. BG9H]|uniref:Integral membrane regulator n=1 Tax=Streptomyces anatolicus TaxID=2675858 RepID=A0ABS6YL01_9ACTN|nr:Pr6Pr family membrane protein [Streptomyces anatolicus]MBW5422098.1 integral membrane regulator [Streptomyces anatolicus]
MIAPTPPLGTASASGVPAEAVVPPVRRPLVAAVRALIALAAATGIVIDLVIGSPPRVLSYFTVQSNALVAVVLGLSAWRAWRGRRRLPPWVTGGTLLFIAITGLVYHLVLANASSGFSMTEETTSASDWHTLSNLLLHTVTPIAVALDWLLLTRPGGLRWRHASLWLLYPLAYLAFALTRGALLPPGSTARYPYPFLDVTTHGYGSVLGNALTFGLAFYALALTAVALDRIRPWPRPPENRISPQAAGPLK